MRKLKVSIDGKEYDVGVEEKGSGEFDVEFNKKKYAVKTEEEITEEETQVQASTAKASNSKSLTAQIPGTVGKIKIKPGSSVKSGEVLLTLIAMKMENEIKATLDGKIKKINVKEGENVDVGHLLIEFE